MPFDVKRMVYGGSSLHPPTLESAKTDSFAPRSWSRPERAMHVVTRAQLAGLGARDASTHGW